ncbi:MAG: hypothetical protein U9N12_06595 [Euryarchaeota archaeon]|nr:hypothetical protein [Euryarchaeota archaeon]
MLVLSGMCIRARARRFKRRPATQGRGIRFMCMRGRMPENVDVWKRVMLTGDGADITGCHRLSKTIIIR